MPRSFDVIGAVQKNRTIFSLFKQINDLKTKHKNTRRMLIYKVNSPFSAQIYPLRHITGSPRRKLAKFRLHDHGLYGYSFTARTLMAG